MIDEPMVVVVGSAEDMCMEIMWREQDGWRLLTRDLNNRGEWVLAFVPRPLTSKEKEMLDQ